jgi:PHP family Zn ribbon phosphoesterase
MALRLLRADLHIHTCLSPCGELTMSPRAVVGRARDAGLDLIAVTDHNTTENADAVIEAAAGTGLAVLPGIEMTTAEEVHILGLFEAGTALGPFQAEVYRNLPDLPSMMRFVDDQVIVDAADFVSGFCPHCLFGATLFSIQDAVGLIHRNGGLAIACHVDRDSYSIISQLGFIPPGLRLEAVEVSPRRSADEARRDFGALDRLPVVRFSDAHKPEEIGAAVTEFLVDGPALEEIRRALAGEDGRKVILP